MILIGRFDNFGFVFQLSEDNSSMILLGIQQKSLAIQ